MVILLHSTLVTYLLAYSWIHTIMIVQLNFFALPSNTLVN